MLFPLFIGALVLTIALIITHGTRRTWPQTDAQPEVTVVVCARDEEASLMESLVSLATQDYPDDKYQLILVDHLSKDSTGEIMEMVAEMIPVPTEVIHITEPDDVLPGKEHALEVGLSHVTTEYVLMTDGDCIVPETWISTMVKYFRENVIAVSGLVTVGRDGVPDTAVARLQHVDHRYYLGMLAGLSGLRAPGRGKHFKDYLPDWIRQLFTPLRPAFCIGNNLALRMSAYRAVGGYRALGPSLIEDYALMNLMVGKTRKQLAVILDPEARVFTTPQTTLHGLWRQKRRWGTATRVWNPLSAILFIAIISIRVVVPWLILAWPIPSLIALVAMGVGDALVIRNVSRRTGERVRLREIIFQEVYQIVLNHLLVTAAIINWPVVWKGQKYHRLGTKRKAS